MPWARMPNTFCVASTSPTPVQIAAIHRQRCNPLRIEAALIRQS